MPELISTPARGPSAPRAQLPRSIATGQCHNSQHLRPHEMPPASLFSSWVSFLHSSVCFLHTPGSSPLFLLSGTPTPTTLVLLGSPREAPSELLCNSAGRLENCVETVMKTCAAFALNTGASPESQGGSATGALLGFIISRSAFPATATGMGLSQESVTQGPKLASVR